MACREDTEQIRDHIAAHDTVNFDRSDKILGEQSSDVVRRLPPDRFLERQSVKTAAI